MTFVTAAMFAVAELKDLTPATSDDCMLLYAFVHAKHWVKARSPESEYFKDSKTVLVRLTDLAIWQSNYEGYIWEQKLPEERFPAFYMHTYSNELTYLLTTDAGHNWLSSKAPSPPNSFGAQVLPLPLPAQLRVSHLDR
ncbi:hypothetical protein BDR03DRAFT_987323 [Suillus americanus]|nr:hypothetical protein BDR03DRAFT_987323 [Suillus americanus]